MSKDKKNSAFMKPVEFTAELAEIVGRGPLPRTEIIKALWKYIRQHNLQDPNDKRNIKPDQKLAKIVGSQPINMFKMTGKVAEHIKK